MGLTEELRWTAARLMSVGKLAVDSALTESLKGSMQVFSLVKGKLKGGVPTNRSNENKIRNFIVVDEMQAKLEKMQRDMKEIKQQNDISAISTEGEEQPKQTHNREPVKVTDPETATRKKIFVRSRL